MSDLNTCPFCGAVVELVDNDVGASIECECGCGLVECDWSRAKAAEIWNNRKKQDSWISVNTPEDIPVRKEVLCFDGCDISIDFVEACTKTGCFYMANGTDITHYQPLPKPPVKGVKL